MPPTPLFIVVLHLIQPFWTAPKILNREKLEAVSPVEGSKLLTAVELLSNKGTGVHFVSNLVLDEILSTGLVLFLGRP